MKRVLLFILVLLFLVVGAGIAVRTWWKSDTDVIQNVQTDAITQTNHTAHSNTQTLRRTSLPTECFDDKSPSVCSGGFDVVKTEQNSICNCKTTAHGKIYVKQYNVKATYEYSLGLGENNVITDELNKNNMCDAICNNFANQIEQGTFIPREYFTINTKCEDAMEISYDEETRYYSQCKCMISDESNTPTWFDMARVKHNEFTEKTPEQAVAQCNRWCGRLCDSVFSVYIKEHPEFELVNTKVNQNEQ